MSAELEFTALDRQFAALMLRLAKKPSPELETAALQVSAWRRGGHICCEYRGPRAKLLESGVVGEGEEFHPLVLDPAGRLYLRRYWSYESELAATIRERAARTLSVEEKGVTFDPRLNERQQLAAHTALRRSFTVITGGPGTGKTYTVAAVLALLRAQKPACRIALAAPTGKAAARLQESLAGAASLGVEAMTIHRLLGVIPHSPYFRHDAARPLPCDVLVVDEASMIDLALMAKLLAAVPSEARVILLGDKDQLASVEAGYVLGDICNVGGSAESAGPLREGIVELRESHRFASGSGIYQLAEAVNRGAAPEALDLLQSGAHADVALRKLPGPQGLAAALQSVVESFRPYLTAATPEDALARWGGLQILSAVRRGPYGVGNLNQLMVELLARAGLITPAGGAVYRGRPIMIRENDHNLRLYNGDVGIIWPDPAADGELRAFFRDAAGEARPFLPGRLPAHETAFALTVHKSQGSEFERVLLILPEKDAPVVTRELVYTAITRARRQLEVWAREEVLNAGIGRRVVRGSGLREALWKRGM